MSGGWRVLLGEVGSGVCDFEAAVAGGGEFQEVAGVGAGYVCDVFFGGVVLGAAFFGEVKLPEGFEAGRFCEGLEGWG